MLIDAADTATRFLEYRANRIDPDGIVSRSALLQQRKMENIKAQLARPPVNHWDDLHPGHQARIRNMAQHVADASDPDALNAAFLALRALMLNPMHRDPPAPTEEEADV